MDKLNRYAEFNVLSMPYPGCEFFRAYRDNNYAAEGLVFDWQQSYVDAEIDVPDDQYAAELGIVWSKYKEWELITMTQNYLRLLLKYLQENSDGILIHCISGWDRTPLFISMLRLSLWADGVLHQSLTAEQILYLTLAYDWYLFGHNLSNRLDKGEEIMFFCFYVLKFLHDDKYSVHGRPRRKYTSSGDSSVDVLRTGSDTAMDDLAREVDGHGSDLSLNSYESSNSIRSEMKEKQRNNAVDRRNG